MNSAKIALLINKASPTISRTVGRSGLHLKKQAPHILFGVGVVGAVASTVLACRSTLKLAVTLDEIEKDLDTARATDHDVAVEYIKSAAKLGRLYGPSLAVGVVSIGCLSRAHVDLSKRNASLVAAYATLQGAFDSYRDRVRDDVGAERELDLYRGVIETKVNADGEIERVFDLNGPSPYSRFFDEHSSHWEKNAEMNHTYLRCQQNYANDLLNARGHVFLNDVYDLLGFERTPAGAVVGWLKGGDGDDYVSFDIDNDDNLKFVNQLDNTVRLDFNVDGVIYDKI